MPNLKDENKNIIIRPAEAGDAEAILKVYSYYILNTVITFETEVPSVRNFKKRIESITKDYPYLVCEQNGEIIGYAYASRHGERAAYLHSADVSIYISPEYHGTGIGKALYKSLFEALYEYDYYMAYASITLPNEKSLGLHKSFGFKEVGVMHNVGYKQGKWLSLLWLEKPIKDPNMIEIKEA